MSSDATDNTMRAGFEAWVKTAQDAMWGPYANAEVEGAWAGWQAARANTARQIEQAIEAEREAIRKAMRQVLFTVPRHQRDSNDILDFYVGRVIAARSTPTPPTA